MGWFFFSDECPIYLFQLPNPKIDIVWARAKFLQHIRLKKSSKWITWDGMTGCGLTGIHFFTPRTDFDCRLLHQQHITETSEACPSPYVKVWMKQQTRENCSPEIATWRWSKTGHQHTQPRPPTRGAKKNLPNFIEKPCWPPNFPDINPVENLWSIMDEVVYKDPTPKTMKDLKRRLKQAWKKIPLSTPHDLSHSMPQRLRNVITNKGGHAGYWLSKYMCSVKQ